jgi:DhnA family fructose-bisphosphate aldolase class Ia
MLMRIDLDDPTTVDTIEARSGAVNELAQWQLIAMIEPFVSHRVDGRVSNELTAEAMIRASPISSGLGTTSAYTWLKVPIVDEMERVMAATTLPALILGGEAGDDVDAAFESWRRALTLPTVQGLVIGRRLLYPPDDDVAAAVDIPVGLFAGSPSLV